jgi:uncharacterized heparinase superfamily protein
MNIAAFRGVNQVYSDRGAKSPNAVATAIASIHPAVRTFADNVAKTPPGNQR